MKYLIPLILGALTGGFIAWNATVSTSELSLGTAPFTLQSVQLATNPTNGDCLTTNGTDNSWSSSCGGGGVASSVWSWEDEASNTISPNVASTSNTAIVKASNFTATSTSATSSFPLAHITTALNIFGNYGTALSDFCVAITGGAGLCDGTDNTGSGGSGLATSTAIADTYVIYGTSAADVGAEAAFTYDDATNKLTVDNASTTNLSATNLWGALTGNADTATALAANGANCSAGNSPLGVDASGAVESCFDVWTEAENTSAAYISNLSGFDTDDLTQGATNLYNQTHSGDVTGATTLAIANDVVAFTDIAYSITLAGNPALGASESYFGANGIIFEGSTANTSETLLTVTNPTADRTITFPDASITVAGLTSAMTGTFDGNNFGGGAIGTNEMLYGSSAGVLGEIAAGTSAQLLQANGSGVPGFVTMSGDATIAAGGALTIASDAIEESMLKAVDTAADEECLTYETTTGDFEWQDCGSGGGGTGAGTATTTDINGGDGTSETITYSNNDFYVGGSSSTTAEFNFDPETSKFAIASTTATAANLSMEGVSILDSVSGTLTLDNIDALGSTAEATIEAAIDTLSNLVTVGTISAGTWAADLAADTVDAITEIAAAIRTGADAFLVTGTAGTNGNLLQWNGDGDAVDSGLATANVPLLNGEADYTGTHDFDGATIAGMQYYPALTYATTSWNGTTTLALGPAFNAQTWANTACWADATTTFQFGDGTNWMNFRTATTGVSVFALSTNNSFTAAEKRFVRASSTSGTYISCTVDYQDD